MLIWLPLEPLEERYTKDWARQFPKQFKEDNINFLTVNGNSLTSTVELGSVLDGYGTHFWKFSQLCNLITLMRNKEITSNDVLLFADLWFPGIEALRYISDLGGCRPKITGILHAGSYDPNDFTYRQGMRPWAHQIEDAWFQIYDLVFVATQFHKNLILRNHNVDPEKIVVTGLPFYPDEITEPRKHIKKIENYVVFPHRLDPEKHPEEFDDLMKKFPEMKVLKTAEKFLHDKQGYYDELAKADIAISTATQETFGYAMLEATALGCIPLVPDRLSYHEMYPKICRYKTLFDLEDKLDRLQNNEEKRRYHYSAQECVTYFHRSLGMSAITNMINAIENKFPECH